MKRYKIEQAIKDGIVIFLRVVAALSAVIADGTYWLYDHAQTRFAPPEPPKRVRIPVRQLGLRTGQFVPIRRPVRVPIAIKYRTDRGRKINVRLPRKIKVKYGS